MNRRQSRTRKQEDEFKQSATRLKSSFRQIKKEDNLVKKPRCQCATGIRAFCIPWPCASVF
ncbi:hypothetical protein EFP50_04765 [Lacticaseibacillus paracasei]|nr:hypothetical protein [Lacticaseibacillus paracasei]MCT3333900.1 hypothetical protein [Lacticaseibacillus paracasei]